MNRDNDRRTIFSAFPVPKGHPVLARRSSPLPVAHLIEAARLATAYPRDPVLRGLTPAIVTLTLTPEEFAEVLACGFLAAWRDREKSGSCLAMFAAVLAQVGKASRNRRCSEPAHGVSSEWSVDNSRRR